MSTEQKVSRDRILQGAEAILASGAYSDLTVDALARSLRMSKSTLYKYFPSKENVVVALVEDACARADAELEEASHADDASARLSQLTEALGRYGRRLPRAVVVEASKIPLTCRARIERTRAAFGAAVASAITNGQSRGKFTVSDPNLASTAFSAAALAVLVDAPHPGNPASVTDLFLPGLTA